MTTSSATTVKEYLDELPLDAIGKIIASLPPDRMIAYAKGARRR